MDRTRWRLMVACLAVIGAAIAVAGGSAGNRDREGTLVALPGPGSVTYGENIAFKATFTNKDTNKATFTQTKYVMPPPTAPAGVEVTSVSASCGTFDLATDVLTCEFGQVRPGDSVDLIVVWHVGADASKPGCENCLDATGTWLIKEGKPTNLNETLDVAAEASLIGVSDQSPFSAKQRAGGFELEGCTATNPTSLSTNQALNATTNPVSTSFCIPGTFHPTEPAGGVAATITEPDDPAAANYARQSEVCIAQPGANCPGGLAATFGDEFIVFTFRVADAALPSGFKITQVFHNVTDQALPPCKPLDTDNTDPNGCVVSITPPKGPGIKTWTIVAKAKKNGPWNW